MTIYIAGVDEVGRGPLAGPVVTAAVILKERIEGIRDSKKLTLKKRLYFAKWIEDNAIAFAFGRAEVHEIEELNIHHATLLAMKRSVEALAIQPTKVMVDGIFLPQISIPCEAVVGGDDIIYEISAASILAKVARDAEMEVLDRQYPGYGFSQNKGYATEVHRKALIKMGPSAVHRKNFSLVNMARHCEE